MSQEKNRSDIHQMNAERGRKGESASPREVWIGVLTAAVVLGQAAPALGTDENPTPGFADRTLAALEWTVDLTLVRPLLVAQVAVGAVALAPIALLSAPGGVDNMYDAYDIFVGSRVQEAFQRDLGDFGARDE